MIWCNIVLLFDFIYKKLQCLLNQNNLILKIPSRSRSRSLKLSIFLLENGKFLQYFISNFLIYVIISFLFRIMLQHTTLFRNNDTMSKNNLLKVKVKVTKARNLPKMTDFCQFLSNFFLIFV